MQVLIGEIDGRAGDREREQGRDHHDGGPLRGRFCEAAAGDAPASVEDEEDPGELPEQDIP